MPTSVGNPIIGLAIVLAILGSAPLAILFAVLAVLWEVFLFVRAGMVE